MLAIIDYKAGNQTSVARAFDSLGIQNLVTADPADAAKAEGIVFPGVGAAGQAMQAIRQAGIDRLLADSVASGKPVLGICLGCQILLDKSEENDASLLGIVPGICRRFAPDMKEAGEDKSLVVPHMGWNTAVPDRKNRLFAGIDPDSEFYFVHSYYTIPAPEYVLAKTRYGISFCSAYGRDGLWATQFHPEKSGAPGLRLLRNFYDYCKEKANA